MAEQIEDRVESSSTRRAYREDWDTAIRRLAEEAKAHGVAILHHDNGECVRYYATSQSEPGRLHYVTLTSCDCPGFAHHGRCRHLARLLDVSGNLPPVDAPAETGTTTQTCPNCLGGGWVGQDDRWMGACSRCGGTGVIRIHWGAIAPTEINYPPQPAA